MKLGMVGLPNVGKSTLFNAGMSASIQKKIFDSGFSTKQRGWGLGLSLAKRIINDYHQGRIFVKYSVEGQGTVFRIVLNR